MRYAEIALVVYRVAQLRHNKILRNAVDLTNTWLYAELVVLYSMRVQQSSQRLVPKLWRYVGLLYCFPNTKGIRMLNYNYARVYKLKVL